MDLKRMTAILEDKTAFAALQRCSSISERMLRLNQAGVDCTHDECKRLLRAWEHYADDNEVLNVDDMDMVAGGAGFADYITKVFTYASPSVMQRKTPWNK